MRPGAGLREGPVSCSVPSGADAPRESQLVSMCALLETEWVLRSRYKVNRKAMATAFISKLETPGIEFEHDATVEEALYLLDQIPSADFADCLLAARTTHLGRSRFMTSMPEPHVCRAENRPLLPVATDRFRDATFYDRVTTSTACASFVLRDLDERSAADLEWIASGMHLALVEVEGDMARRAYPITWARERLRELLDTHAAPPGTRPSCRVAGRSDAHRRPFATACFREPAWGALHADGSRSSAERR